MRQWVRRSRGALAMGLTWAVVWAPAAVLLGLFVDPDGSMDEMWIAVGAYPGFLGGVVFSAVLGIAARRRPFEQLSIPRFAAWGALAGLLVALLPAAVAETPGGRPLWLLAAVVVGSITLLSAVSAAGSLALARMAERRAPGAARVPRTIGRVPEARRASMSAGSPPAPRSVTSADGRNQPAGAGAADRAVVAPPAPRETP